MLQVQKAEPIWAVPLDIESRFMNPEIGPASRRVGIFTYHFSDNFGAGLQAYGLREWLLRQGVEAEFVNYHPSHVEAGGRFQSPFTAGGLKADAKIVYLWLSRLRHEWFGNAAQKTLFQKFQRETLNVKGPRLATLADVDAYLSSPAGRFDLLICGSDQIWAPSQQFGIDPVYYLAFPGGAQGAHRVAYAPSFGRASLDPAFRDAAAQHLAAFDGLSAREKSGVTTVENLTGRAVAWVPDPTILLGDFTGLVQSHGADVGEDHVFCYALRTGAGIRDVAMAASARLNAPILSPFNPHRRWREIGQTIYPSPEQWVAHLAKSKYVVTNSFHGTVFSILFRKPFLTVELPGSRAALNERSRSLLQALGLEERMVDGSDATAVQRMLDRPIDWDSVTPRLTDLQSAGRAYLTQQISELDTSQPMHRSETE